MTTDFLTILKANPNRWPAGAPASQGGQYAPAPAGKGSGDTKTQIDKVKKLGIRVEGAVEKFSYGAAVGDFIEKVVGQSFQFDKLGFAGGVLTTTENSKLFLSLTDSTIFDDVHVEEMERTFDFKNKVVTHDMLILGEKGKGGAKKLFTGWLAAYKEAGFKEIRLNANINLGAYAWAKYGFKAREPKAFSDMVMQQLERASLLPDNPEEKAEWDGLKELLKKNEFNPMVTQILADAKTPHLDKGMQKLHRDPKTTYLKKLLHDTSWKGYLDLDDKDSVKRMEAYLGEKSEKEKR